MRTRRFRTVLGPVPAGDENTHPKVGAANQLIAFLAAKGHSTEWRSSVGPVEAGQAELDVHPRQLRHTFAPVWPRAGARAYGPATADEQAREAHRRFAPASASTANRLQREAVGVRLFAASARRRRSASGSSLRISLPLKPSP